MLCTYPYTCLITTFHFITGNVTADPDENPGAGDDGKKTTRKFQILQSLYSQFKTV